MGFIDFMKKVGSGINKGLKQTKIISTLAPIAGTITGNPALGTAIGAVAKSAGYEKGGRITPRTRPTPMRKGGRVRMKKMKK